VVQKQVVIVLGVLLFSGVMSTPCRAQVDSTAYSVGFSTYLSHTDKYAAGFDICTDKDGNIYVSGNTRDRNFPATEGSYQTEIKGEADAFVAKFSPEGELVFASLVGGAKREHHTGITVDDAGYIFLIGGTQSADFPVTEGAYDTSFNGEGEWAGDVFLTKMTPAGDDIVFSTFIGGEVEETAGSGSVKIDSRGNIVIGGATCSPDFPATNGVIDQEYTKQDCFVAKLSPDGARLLFSTSLSNGKMEMVTGLAVDDEDNIYVTGFAVADDLPVTADAIRATRIMPTVGGFEDGIDHFVAKINPTGTRVSYLSYLGGGGHMGSTISWSSPNRLLVCGSTKEEGFPIVGKAVGAVSKGERDCFISVFDSEDMTLEYSSLFGGNGADNIQSAYFLDPDTIVVGGKTTSPDFPLTDDAFLAEYPTWEKTFNATFWGRRKSFVSVIDIQKGELIYSTYLGACFQFRICADAMGNIGFVGEAGQREASGMTGFPITDNAIQEPPTYLMLGKLTRP